MHETPHLLGASVNRKFKPEFNEAVRGPGIGATGNSGAIAAGGGGGSNGSEQQQLVSYKILKINFQSLILIIICSSFFHQSHQLHPNSRNNQNLQQNLQSPTDETEEGSIENDRVEYAVLLPDSFAILDATFDDELNFLL